MWGSVETMRCALKQVARKHYRTWGYGMGKRTKATEQNGLTGRWKERKKWKRKGAQKAQPKAGFEEIKTFWLQWSAVTPLHRSIHCYATMGNEDGSQFGDLCGFRIEITHRVQKGTMNSCIHRRGQPLAPFSFCQSRHLPLSLSFCHLSISLVNKTAEVQFFRRTSCNDATCTSNIRRYTSSSFLYFVAE